MKHTLILDRDWRFLLGDGEFEAISTHADSYSSSKAGSERGIPSMRYDDSEWRVVNLPHDYLTETDFREENLISHGYKHAAMPGIASLSVCRRNMRASICSSPLRVWQ
jgi:beta-galactosidase